MKKSLVLFCLLSFILAWGQNRSLYVNQMADEIPGAGFSALKNHFHNYVDSGTLAGVSMLVSRGDKVSWDYYGMQNIEDGTPMSGNTIFRLASMTKPIVSVAVMTLVEEGKLQLDDEVQQFIPAFKKLQVYQPDKHFIKPKSSITIRHLLSHTGGLTSGFDPSPAGKICRQTMHQQRPGSLHAIIETLAEIPLAFHPGEGWAYSYSTDILAYIVEQVSGVPIEKYLSRKIFEPLEMDDTGFQVPKYKVDRLATLYATGDDGKLVAADTPEDSPYTNGTYFPRGNGGLTSTIMDYYRFARMLLNGGAYRDVRILKEETIELMATNLLPADQLPINVGGNALPGQGFGLGFGVLLNNPPFGTEGDYFWPGAAFTYFFISPETDMIGVFMTQLSDMRKMHLIGEFHGLASQALDPK